MNIVDTARQFRFVREAAPNAGRWVETIQKLTGNKAGDSWCASFVSLVLGIAYQNRSPIPFSASCDVLLQACRAQHYLVDIPEPGDLYFYLNTPDDAHHVGIVTAYFRTANPPTVMGIAGNTSKDGKSSNGDGVYEHVIPTEKIVYAHLPPYGA